MITILPQTTKSPLQIIGVTSAICWDSKTTDIEKNRKRAIDCILSGHDRVLEWVNVEIIIDGYSAKMMRELMRHIVGTSVLQASTRYIDYEKGFSTVIPKAVAQNERASAVWDDAMKAIHSAMTELKELGIPKEDYTNLLPLAYQSKLVLKLNLRALVHFMNMRLCGRAYWEIRQFSAELRAALIKYGDSPDNSRNEWKEVAENLFVPKCKAVGFCTETRGSCGLMPLKDREWIADE